MGHYEDFWWEITESIDKLGLKKEFDAQLNKMRSQDKHKYKTACESWEYALRRIQE